jgi:hypothetical protein
MTTGLLRKAERTINRFSCSGSPTAGCDWPGQRRGPKVARPEIEPPHPHHIARSMRQAPWLQLICRCFEPPPIFRLLSLSGCRHQNVLRRDVARGSVQSDAVVVMSRDCRTPTSTLLNIGSPGFGAEAQAAHRRRSSRIGSSFARRSRIKSPDKPWLRDLRGFLPWALANGDQTSELS